MLNFKRKIIYFYSHDGQLTRPLSEDRDEPFFPPVLEEAPPASSDRASHEITTVDKALFFERDSWCACAPPVADGFMAQIAANMQAVRSAVFNSESSFWTAVIRAFSLKTRDNDDPEKEIALNMDVYRYDPDEGLKIVARSNGDMTDSMYENTRGIDRDADMVIIEAINNPGVLVFDDDRGKILEHKKFAGQDLYEITVMVNQLIASLSERSQDQGVPEILQVLQEMQKHLLDNGNLFVKGAMEDKIQFLVAIKDYMSQLRTPMREDVTVTIGRDEISWEAALGYLRTRTERDFLSMRSVDHVADTEKFKNNIEPHFNNKHYWYMGLPYQRAAVYDEASGLVFAVYLKADQKLSANIDAQELQEKFGQPMAGVARMIGKKYREVMDDWFSEDVKKIRCLGFQYLKDSVTRKSLRVELREALKTERVFLLEAWYWKRMKRLLQKDQFTETERNSIVQHYHEDAPLIITLLAEEYGKNVSVGAYNPKLEDNPGIRKIIIKLTSIGRLGRDLMRKLARNVGFIISLKGIVGWKEDDTEFISVAERMITNPG